jgi:hypothetical protein
MGPKWPSPNIICITAVLIQINLHPFSWYCQFSCYTTEQEEEWSGRHTPWDMHTMWMQLLAPVVSLQNSMGACASIVHKLHSKNVECAFSSQAVTCSLELSKCCRLVFFSWLGPVYTFTTVTETRFKYSLCSTFLTVGVYGLQLFFFGFKWMKGWSVFARFPLIECTSLWSLCEQRLQQGYVDPIIVS